MSRGGKNEPSDAEMFVHGFSRQNGNRSSPFRRSMYPNFSIPFSPKPVLIVETSVSVPFLCKAGILTIGFMEFFLNCKLLQHLINQTVELLFH